MSDKNYVSKEEMMLELNRLKETGEISERLHLIFYEISNRYSTTNWFRGYTYRLDMVMEGYIRCVRVASKFDTEKYSNPFGYFTMVIHRVFRNFIIKEKKQQDKKWQSMKIIYEKYKLIDNIDLVLSDDLMDKMYPTQND